MTEYHRLIYLHSFFNQSFRCSRHAKSANTYIPSAAAAQDRPSNCWTIFWGFHLLWLSSWTLQCWFCCDAPEIIVTSRVQFYFWVNWSFKGIVRDLVKCWHCVCFKIGLSYACWVPGQTRHRRARMNSVYVTPVTDVAAQTHPWLVVLFKFGWLALGMMRDSVQGWGKHIRVSQSEAE